MERCVCWKKNNYIYSIILINQSWIKRALQTLRLVKGLGVT